MIDLQVNIDRVNNFIAKELETLPFDTSVRIGMLVGLIAVLTNSWAYMLANLMPTEQAKDIVLKIEAQFLERALIWVDQYAEERANTANRESLNGAEPELDAVVDDILKTLH